MTKVNKKHIKKAIIIYEDPDLGEGRRVIFGDPKEVINLLISQMPIVMDKVGKMVGRDFKSPMELITYYLTHKKDFETLHGLDASDDMELELTYEVKKL